MTLLLGLHGQEEIKAVHLAFYSACEETNGLVCENTAVGKASSLSLQGSPTAVPSPGSWKWRRPGAEAGAAGWAGRALLIVGEAVTVHPWVHVPLWLQSL